MATDTPPCDALTLAQEFRVCTYCESMSVQSTLCASCLSNRVLINTLKKYAILSREEFGLLQHFLTVAAWIRMEQIHAVSSGEYPMDLTQGFLMESAQREQKALSPLHIKITRFCKQHGII